MRSEKIPLFRGEGLEATKIAKMAKKQPEAEYGGYNHEFVGEVADRYNCQICTKVIREPHLAVCCGQHFCIDTLGYAHVRSLKYL